MNYFIIGDIHGCYYTLSELLEKHWDSKNENLIILGDFVNKGKYTFAVLEYLMKLQKGFGEKLVILKGNNEFLFEEYYRDSISAKTKHKFESRGLDYVQTLDWMNKLPHQWQNSFIYASHAGVSEDVEFPVNDDDLRILFNRKPLQNIGKTQFLGHLVVEQPRFDENANAWYLDTGAGFGKKLTAVKVNEIGEVTEIISIVVNEQDVSS